MRRFIVVFLILISFFQTGCWDMEEINEIGIVLAVGIDFTKVTNNYTVTVQISGSAPGGANGSNTGTSGSTWNCKADGASIFEAIRNIARISSKRIIWSHNVVVILGEALAKNDITSVLDFLTHSPQLRMKTTMLVSKGLAEDCINSRAGSDILTGVSLGAMARYASLPAVSVESDVKTIYSDFTSDYAQMLISGIVKKKNVVAAIEQDNIVHNDALAIEGAAVFKKSKMIGWLTPEETRGLAWIFDYAKGTVVAISYTDSENKKSIVSIETKGVKSKITSEIINGIPNFTIKITGRGKIVEEDSPTNISIIEFEKKVGELLDKEICKDMKIGIDKVQKSYRSDVLGFAQIVRAQNNKEWKNGLKDKWQYTFPIVPIKTEVEIDINSSTLNQEPVHETKGK